jgi:hypothetical protein
MFMILIFGPSYYRTGSVALRARYHITRVYTGVATNKCILQTDGSYLPHNPYIFCAYRASLVLLLTSTYVLLRLLFHWYLF